MRTPASTFTPADFVHLMVDVVLAGDRRRLRTKGVVLGVYERCWGSGGMLTIAKAYATAGEDARRGVLRPDRELGRRHPPVRPGEPETFAICKSELFMKSEDGCDAENVVFGSTAH